MRRILCWIWGHQWASIAILDELGDNPQIVARNCLWCGLDGKDLTP